MAICIERRRGCPTETISSLDELLALFRLPGVKDAIATCRQWSDKEWEAAKAGDAYHEKEYHGKAGEAKSDLPGVIFQCSSFREHRWVDRKNVDHGVGTWRHQEHCVLNGLFMVDIDHVEDPDKLWSELVAKGLMDWKPLFGFKTPSGHGLKIVMPTDLSRGNLFGNQSAFAKAFGVEIDQKTKDASRLSFVSTSEDIYLFDPELMTYENEKFIAKYNGKYNDGSADLDLFHDAPQHTADTGGAKAGEQEDGAWIGSQLALLRNGDQLPDENDLENRTFRGVRVRDIIDAYFEGHQPAIGDRHDTLLHFASELRHIVEKNRRAVYYYCLRLPFVQDLFKEGDPVAETIGDALGYKYSTNMPKRMKAAIEAVKKSQATATSTEITPETIRERLYGFGVELQELFEYYPTMKEACYNLGPASYPAILFSTSCLYGTLATRTWYHHYFEPEVIRRLNYEIFVIADPASGKSIIGKLYKIILAPIIAVDKKFNDEINRHKKKQQAAEFASDKAKGKEPVTPPVSKVRIHGSRTANNIFIEDMMNNNEEVDGQLMYLHLFTFDSELENASLASKGGQWIDKSVFELKAFHNEEDNQQYRNKDAVTGPFDVFWNFIYTGTPYSLYRKVTKRNFGSGLSTRLAVLPLCNEKFKMCKYVKNWSVNVQNNDVLKTWAFKMDEVKGELPIEPLVEHAYKWTDRLAKIAEKTNDEALFFTIMRISYYGLHCAVPFIIMRHWDEWTKNQNLPIDDIDKRLCETFMEIQLFSQKVYFGKFTLDYYNGRNEQVMENAADSTLQKSLDLLNKVNETFTAKDFQNATGYSNTHSYVLLDYLVKNKVIKKEKSKGRFQYRKGE